MAEFNWCHNPGCHKIATHSRIRGTGNNKVLRTRKIALNSEWIRESIYAYFCNQRCLHDYLNKHAQAVVNIAPRREALETPIKVEKEKYESYRYRYNDSGNYQRVPYQATKTTIKSVDND